MTDNDFEEQAAITILAALVSNPEGFAKLPPQDAKDDAAGYAEKAYKLASALKEHRKKKLGRTAAGFVKQS
jgi:hypothetical protein